jgi:DNA-binding NarL/FixJ family response regulator
VAEPISACRVSGRLRDGRRQHRAELILAEARAHLASGRLPEAADTIERAIAALDGRAADDRAPAEVLTPGELRVARMAADGNKNREIADDLGVSIKAIEYHLANTYRKLGIRGRTELARMFNFAAPLLAVFGAGA